MDSIVLGGGCFWCLDASFRLINGITSVVSGYSGGSLADPTYQQVSYEETGHAEVVQISFDTSIISLSDILDIFWILHDPTTKNRQGADVGTQYRSVIFYSNEQQREIVEASLTEAQKVWPDPIVTEVRPLDKFYPAEDYHQDYFAKNPEQGYCQVVINPKLTKLREKFAARLK